MPISRLTPLPDDVLGTKDVTPPEWATEGEHREYFTILDFLRSETLEVARTAARKTIQQGKVTREEFTTSTYLRVLFEAQVKGWRLLDATGAEIPFTPENLARLPWAVRDWLHERILECGGMLATSDLEVLAGEQRITFPGADAGVGAGQTHQVPDTVRDGVVQQARPRHRV